MIIRTYRPERKLDKIDLKKGDVVIDYVCGPGRYLKRTSDIADIIYALDMFHKVDNPDGFFSELHRIIKRNGKLYIEDGHKSRDVSLEKNI